MSTTTDLIVHFNAPFFTHDRSLLHTTVPRYNNITGSAVNPALSDRSMMHAAVTVPLAKLPEVYPHPVRSEWKVIAACRAEIPECPISILAQKVGRSTASVRVWLRAPLYQSYENWVFDQRKVGWTAYERASLGDVPTKLQEWSNEMLERLRDIAETTEDEKLQATIAQDFLDRAGYSPRSRGDGRATNIVLTGEAMAEILRRATEARGTIVVGTAASDRSLLDRSLRDSSLV